jgi:predicted HTH domain antitoxin
MMTIQMAVPDELLLALKPKEEELAFELSMAAAVKLYELGRLSSGAAAELAGLPKPVFMSRLVDYGVPIFDMTEEELRADLQNA